MQGTPGISGSDVFCELLKGGNWKKQGDFPFHYKQLKEFCDKRKIIGKYTVNGWTTYDVSDGKLSEWKNDKPMYYLLELLVKRMKSHIIHGGIYCCWIESTHNCCCDEVINSLSNYNVQGDLKKRQEHLNM